MSLCDPFRQTGILIILRFVLQIKCSFVFLLRMLADIIIIWLKLLICLKSLNSLYFSIKRQICKTFIFIVEKLKRRDWFFPLGFLINSIKKKNLRETLFSSFLPFPIFSQVLRGSYPLVICPLINQRTQTKRYPSRYRHRNSLREREKSFLILTKLYKSRTTERNDSSDAKKLW